MTLLSSLPPRHLRRPASFVRAACCWALLRLFGFYAIVQERTVPRLRAVRQGRRRSSTSRACTSSGQDWAGRRRSSTGWAAATCLDMRLDQEYLRSQPVNSEEGAPMGIGIWYEMFISDPVAYLFKNADPRGSLARQRQQLHGALPEQHEAGGHAGEPPRHEPDGARRGLAASRTSGATSSARSTSARCTSATPAMIQQIEEKVVNRLRQVTSAIKQDGANQVSIITSTAERQAAIEFAKAAAMRPRIVGEALNRVAADPDVEAAMFEISRDSEDHRQQGADHADPGERRDSPRTAGVVVAVFGHTRVGVGTDSSQGHGVVIDAAGPGSGEVAWADSLGRSEAQGYVGLE